MMSPGPLLRVEDLRKYFVSGGVVRRAAPIRAVDGVSIEVARGEIVGIVGESGSGKSTLVRCVLGLEPLTSGRIWFSGVEWSGSGRRQRNSARRRIQPVFQDSSGSLDPRWTAGRSIREGLDAFEVGSPEDRDRRVQELLGFVGLSSKLSSRLPHELSGGQRQRVSIAAALALEPELLVADEPVTALDVSVQAQVLNLISRIQRDLQFSVLLISHDLSVVAHISDRVYVMYRGAVVEHGPTAQVLGSPIHPYTQDLIASSPSVTAIRKKDVLPLRRLDAASHEEAEGCRYASRCPIREAICAREDPPLVSYKGGSAAACHVMAARHGDQASVTDLMRHTPPRLGLGSVD